jgi:hypothetical protein
LQEAFDAAPDGAVYVINRHRSQAESAAGWRNSNLRTTFKKIIRRAGLQPWPKPFHGLRASHETDLLERFPIQTVAKWLGHSPKIALAHYARTMDDHFDAAVTPPEATRNPTYSASVRGRKVPSEKGEAPVFTEQHAVLPTYTGVQADGEGFEPPEDFRPQQFSRLPA